MDAPQPSDEMLLAAIAQQDRQAMHRFYVRHSQAIHAFAMRRLQDSNDAQDVVVDTLYEVWRHAAKFQGQSQVRTWVLGIARHKLLDRNRARGQVEIQELDDAIMNTTADQTPGPFAMLVAKQKAEVMMDCLEVLPDVQRECLHLSFYEDLSLKEIAEIQAIPMNTVATRIHHAKRKLAECLSRALGADWRQSA
jgi:RNA polymerase sigma-70 factor, ECF subfamily